MPLLRLIAEGVGPFDRLELDLSDGNGKPHLGPHILAGVNGSGKSTALRAIAWTLDNGRRGFPHDAWQHSTEGYPASRALVLQQPSDDAAVGRNQSDLEWARMQGWDSSRIANLWENGHSVWLSCNEILPLCIAAYSPSRNLKYVSGAKLGQPLENHWVDSLAFETTINNEAIQNWLLSVYSRKAIARERQLPTDQYARSLSRFESALRLLYGEEVSFQVDITPTFQPRLRVRGRDLNFSQLPDGIKATVGWIADFMMRQDLAGVEDGVILLDEVDAHLHPLWQRKLLPAMRKALPNVQIIVTTHSPFVISSCRDARVHVLDLDQHGKASNRPPIDSPIGESVETTLMEIFGVNSRFDVQTEIELSEWNELKKKDAAGKASKADLNRLTELTRILSARSEELKSIVAAPMTIPNSVLKALTGTSPKKRKTG